MSFYVDGSCSKNGYNNSVGGFGVVEIDDYTNETLYTYQYTSKTDTISATNNRMELMAILHVMKNFSVKNEEWSQPPIVYSDSAYAVNTYNNWMFNWSRNNWVKSDKKTPENLDIIKEYYDLYIKGYRIDLRKCKGHNGIIGNELADKLAKSRK